jgi:NAD(P)-dependent dehydrogenase (short-subunit alcohol dehydrogenase family)
MEMPHDMANGVAVVTGGGSGIGRALCQALVQSGIPRVVSADLDFAAAARVAEAINAVYPGAPATPLKLDVADEGAVGDEVRTLEMEIGPINIWCSNAGVHIGEGIGESSDWQKSLSVNLMGHVNAARALIPRMAARKSGHLIITASAAGLLTDLRCAPYTASKHATVAFAEWLSITYADSGVSVSCVCPEGVRTGMTKADSLKTGSASNFLESEDVAREIIDALATRRFLVLPHPRVAVYEQRRAADREHWLDRMRAIRRGLSSPSAAVC